jgi:uncharacterized membrane protein
MNDRTSDSQQRPNFAWSLLCVIVALFLSSLMAEALGFTGHRLMKGDTIWWQFAVYITVAVAIYHALMFMVTRVGKKDTSRPESR